jgi:hypothetical protein
MPFLPDFLFPFTGYRMRFIGPEQGAALLLGLVLIGAFFLPKARMSWLRPAENLLMRLARCPMLAIASTGFCAFAVNAIISVCGRWPIPAVQDEFSYLLQADTFVRGRLSNPAPPVWIPFETFHVILQPTYASKYPPGQGLMLAFGQWLFGSPVVGLWVGTAMACMALCWMLLQWVPPRWALLGSLLTCVHPVMIYWTQSFWGCQWVVAGSALAMGGLRIFLEWPQESRRRLQVAASAIGIGISLMLLTRPSEGAVLSALVLGTLLVIAVRAQRWFWPQSATILFFLALTCAFHAYCNYRITGNARVLPYVVHEQTYGYSPLFVWQHFRAIPQYHHAVIRDMHLLDEPLDYMQHPSVAAYAGVMLEKISRLLFLHCQLICFALGLLALPWVLQRDRHLRWVAGYLAGVATFIMLEVWLLQQYTTALIPMGVLLAMAGLRQLRAWRWHGRHTGLFLVRSTVLLAFLSLISSFAALADKSGDGIIYQADGVRQFAQVRQNYLEKLLAIHGKHIVIVYYGSHHNRAFEWVYNSADLVHDRILWARSSTAEMDRALIDFYKPSRQIWLLFADEKPPRMVKWHEMNEEHAKDFTKK